MERPLVLFKIRGRQSVSDHHIHMFVKNQICHLRRVLRRIGVIAVRHDIALRVNFPEHSPYHVSLSLHILVSDNSTGIPCKLGSTVR